MDKVTVIVPIYNVEKYVRQAIESTINQTYKNLEIILVDDGSTDSSKQICDEYKEKYDRVKVIHKENGGLSDARNAGLEECTGKYIMFLDSDDFLEPDAVENMYNEIVKKDDDRIEWVQRVCVHKDIWEEVGCKVDYFYDLRNIWIESFVNELNNNYGYYIDDNGVRSIKRR